MANFGTSEDFNRLAANADGQQQQREKAAAAAQQRIAGAALEAGPPVFALLAGVSAALIAAQRAELARLTTLDAKHARAPQIASTIAALTSAAPVATRVTARATRALDVARAGAHGLHGFVTGSDGTPLENAVVYMGEQARAKTAKDGYFMIPFAGAATPARDAATPARDAARDGVHVTILSDKGQTLYEDPVPVDTTAGFAYREYVVERG